MNEGTLGARKKRRQSGEKAELCWHGRIGGRFGLTFRILLYRRFKARRGSSFLQDLSSERRNGDSLGSGF